MNAVCHGRGSWGATAALLLALMLLPAASAHADDVPDAAQAAYDAGVGLLAKGDRSSLEKAFALLDTRKDEALTSIDYWTLYARVWQGLLKDEGQLWDGIVKERQAKAPKSVVFDLARARLATKPKEQKAWIDAALKRDKRNLHARAAKGIWLLRAQQADAGAEILESVLEEDEGHADAALALARLSLAEGFPGEAIEYLEGALERTQDARLYHLVALCHERSAKDGDHREAMAKALDAAARALGLHPCEAHIQTYDRLLEQTGDAATAAKALKEHYARTKHPMLAALLAETAFEAGDYEGALLGLEAGDQDDLAVIKGLVTAHARLGHKSEALRAATKVLAMDSAGRLFAARTALHVGDDAAARGHLGALADPEAKLLRARAHAWAGDPDAVAKLGTKEIAAGSRVGEDYLTLWFQARILERLGASMAPAVRKTLLAARFAAGSKPVPQAGDRNADLGKVRTAGWPRRAVTHFRSPCGEPFEAAEEGGMFSGVELAIDDDNTVRIYQSVAGKATCGDDEHTFQLRFNAKTAKSSREGFVELFESGGAKKLGDFEPAAKAFAEACAAWIGGDHEAAEQAAAKALRIEPSFSRVKVYRALARALSPRGEKRADAKDAATSVALWTDDFELRRAVILLRAWAGDAALAEEIDALAAREAAMNVRHIGGL